MQPMAEIHSTLRPATDQYLVENLSYNLSYFNGTGQVLYITTRDGISHRLQPSPLPKPTLRGKLLVRKSIVFAQQNHAIMPGGQNPYVELMAEQYQANHGRNRNRVSTEHIFELDNLLETVHGYSHEFDVVVSTRSPEGLDLHPYSQNYKEVVQTGIDPRFVAGVTVRIVDNSGQMAHRYMNLGGRIIEVKPEVDWSRKEGVYVTIRDNVKGQMVTEYSEPFSHDFSKEKTTEKSPVLYFSREEAKILGDPKAERDRELREEDAKARAGKLKLEAELLGHQRELEVFKADFLLSQQRYQQQRAELEEQLREEEYRRSLERERIKDEYQEKSYKRKESAELLKTLPSIIAGTMALYALFKKI